jgi:hypothetical protein
LRDLYAAGGAKALPPARTKSNIPRAGTDGLPGPGGPSAQHPRGRDLTRHVDVARYFPGGKVPPPLSRPTAGGQAPGRPAPAPGQVRPALATAAVHTALVATLGRIQQAVPLRVRQAAVSFCNLKLSEYRRVFGPRNAKVLVSTAGLLGLVPGPGAPPLGLALLEGAYWSCRGARVVAGPGSKALPADLHERLAAEAIELLQEWYARNGRQATAVPVEVARRAVALVDDDPDTGRADDAAGAKALRGESWFRRCPRDEHGRYLPRRGGASGTAGQPAAAAPTLVPHPRRPTPPLPAPPKAKAKRIKPPTVPAGWLRSPRRAAAVKALHRRTGYAKELDVPDGDEVAEALKQPNPVRHPGGHPPGAGAGGCDCGPGCVCGECRVTYGGGENAGADCGAAGEHQEECQALWAQIQKVDLMIVGLSTALAGARGRSREGMRDPDDLRDRIAGLQRRREQLCLRLAALNVRCPACEIGTRTGRRAGVG